MNKTLLTISGLMIAFAAVRLFLEYGDISLAHCWFANGPINNTERMFANYCPAGASAAGYYDKGGIVIPVWFFQDYEKSKTFLAAFEFPWWTWLYTHNLFATKKSSFLFFITFYAVCIIRGYFFYMNVTRFF